MCSKWVIYTNDADAPQQKTTSESIGGYIFCQLPQIFWRFFCGIDVLYVCMYYMYVTHHYITQRLHPGKHIQILPIAVIFAIRKNYMSLPGEQIDLLNAQRQGIKPIPSFTQINQIYADKSFYNSFIISILKIHKNV